MWHCAAGSFPCLPPVCTHTLKWLPRGDPGYIAGAPRLQVHAGPARAGVLDQHPAQILLPSSEAQSESSAGARHFPLGSGRKGGEWGQGWTGIDVEKRRSGGK